MRTRRRSPRPRFFAIAMLAVLAISVAAPSFASAATLPARAGPDRDRTRVPDPGHQRRRRHQSTVHRGEARHDPGLPGRRAEARATSWTSGALVADSGEQGLLGLAFHPDFETNRTLFVYYTRNGGDIVVSRYTTNAAGTNVDETVPRPLLVIEHSARTNHNGGAMAFGLDGFLYMGVGDGGGAGDPLNNAQKRTNHLGKILRIDVNGTGSGPYDRYAIPPDQSVCRAGVRARRDLGLRLAQSVADLLRSSEWASCSSRMSDRTGTRRSTGSCPARRAARTTAGARWRASTASSRAGARWPATRSPWPNTAMPAGTAPSRAGSSTAGRLQPALVGQYVFADFCSGRIWTMPYAGRDRDASRRLQPHGHVLRRERER